jgi:hypothetical protein
MHTSTLACVLLSYWQHVTTMTAPVGANIRSTLEAMRNTMVDFLLLGVGFRIRFRYAFSDDLLVTFLMASVLAIRTLVSGGILQEVTAQRASHNIVKLLLHKLMTILLMYFLFPLTYGTLTAEAELQSWLPVELDYVLLVLMA